MWLMASLKNETHNSIHKQENNTKTQHRRCAVEENTIHKNE